MKERLLELFADYLDDLDYLEQEQKEILIPMGLEAGRNIPFLYRCFRCMDHPEETAEEKGLSFYMDGECHLVIDRQEIILTEENARELLAKMAGLFETVYPLGTVVELKEEFIKSLHLKKPAGSIRAVIVGRFAALPDGKAYFPYVGSIYPLGIPEQEKLVHFTGASIHSVVQEGYRDDMEDAYVLWKKKELLLDQDAVSFGFLDKEEAVKYVKEMGVLE